MFFLLSKTIYFLAKPFTWIVLAFLLSIFVKRHRQRFFWIGFGLLIFFSNPFLSNAVMRAWEVAPEPVATLPIHRVGIVLGGITTDKEPRDRVHVSGSADRILHAVQLYRQKKISKILVSGGSGKLLKDQVPEAELLKQLLLLSGIPSRDILTESESRNTRENALNSAKLLERAVSQRRILAHHLGLPYAPGRSLLPEGRPGGVPLRDRLPQRRPKVHARRIAAAQRVGDRGLGDSGA